MSKIILDASAWLEYFEDTTLAPTIEEYLQNSVVMTFSITLAEVVAKILRHGKEPTRAITAIKQLSTIMNTTEELSLATAKTYALLRKTKTKISLSDVYLIELARQERAKILTKDTDFEGIKEAVLLR